MNTASNRVAATLATVVIVAFTNPCYSQQQFALGKDEVVVFAGGTNMVHLQQAGHLEAILASDFAPHRPSFRDLSWEADTVFRQGTVVERWRTDGFGTLDEQLQRVGATTVIAQFGQLESMAGPQGIDEFQEAYGRLIDAYQEHAGRVVLVTPVPFEPPPSRLIPDLTKHNSDLAMYVDAITKIAAERQLIVVDLFSSGMSGLTDDGMHIKPASQFSIANEVARQLGVEIPQAAELESLRRAVVEKHRLWYDYWRPANWKLLYGDDGERQFTRGGENYIPFKDEWRKLLPLISKAEQRVWQIAMGEQDAGDNRPAPEVLHGDAQANVEVELSSFTTSAGLHVNLFASEREGLTSPLAIRWDPAGRMYVTVTTTYPHVYPGDLPNDKIIVLEDTDGDGEADRSSVFAEGLNIPTGLEFGDGGVYVGQNTELLFLKDNDGDGKADERRVLLGGFGNGDSHQTINSFIWSPGGELFFGQGDGCESRVATPWGSSDLFQAGFYRLRPRRLQLHPLLDDFMGPGNPWGVAFDPWGQIFSIDGAGGVTYLTPGQVPTSHRLRMRTIGEPGGYCGIGYLDGRQLPDELQGSFAVGDYKANRIKRFVVKGDGAGFSLEWQPPILQSRHRNFRPVDVKVGPDGAVYVVDWYNPITCHQDDAYRDPTRDKAHGRIWRLSTSAPVVKPPQLTQLSIRNVLDALKSPEHWTRYQAKRALTDRDSQLVAKTLNEWVRTLDPNLTEYEHHLYEALGAYETIEVVEPGLLDRLLHAREPKARAYAVRVVGRWHDRLDDPLMLLSDRVADKHPLVRMEAVIACSAIPAPHSIEVAARVVDQPQDEWIEYAFKQTVHHLRPHWMPAFKLGQLTFERPNHLAAVLNEVGGRDVLDSLKKLVESQDLPAASRTAAIGAILSFGDPQDLYDYGLDPSRYSFSGRYDAALHAQMLSRMIELARIRDVRPAGDLAVLLKRLNGEFASNDLQTNTLALAGVWGIQEMSDEVMSAAQNERLPISTRAAAFRAMVELQLPDCGPVLTRYASSANPSPLRSVAIQSLAIVDTPVAAEAAAELFGQTDVQSLDADAVLNSFLNRLGGAESLAAALRQQHLHPASAKQLLRSLFTTGRSDQVLFDVLNQSVGAAATTPDYSEDYVARLVSDASQLGTASRGEMLFKSLACVSCHKVGGDGDANIGPDLTSIGTTLSAERIAEELLWPDRQVKEGYAVVQVITNQGKIHQGYERSTQKNRASDELLIQRVGTQETISIKRADIDELRNTGSPMPTGLTSVLSRTQLLDLIRYLSDLGKIK